MSVKGIQLTERDLAIINALARFKFLTASHVQRFFFPDANVRTAATRLAILTKDTLLSRTFFAPRSSHTAKATHPTAVYFYSPKNRTRLQSYFESHGMAQNFDTFADLAPTGKNDFSSLFLTHELGISDFFLSLEEAFTKHPTHELCFWERTSPLSKTIQDLTGGALTVTTSRGMQKSYFPI